MSSQSTKNLERLEREILQGQMQRSSPGVIQPHFDKAVRQDAQNAITAAIAEKHQIREPTSDNLWVVHYTSIPAVISMLKDAQAGVPKESTGPPTHKYLRMYSTVGSNDPGEGAYLNRFLPEEMLGRNSLNNAERSEFRQQTHQYAYIASFIMPNSQDRVGDATDNLVFWRSYGREGTGCSLKVQMPRDELRAVKYGEQDTKDTGERLGKEIDYLLTVAKRIQDEAQVSLESLSRSIEFTMERFRYLYKSEAYRYEQECRILETPATVEDTDMLPFFEYSGPAGQERTKRYINNPLLAVNKLLVSGSIITLGPRVLNATDTKEYLEHLLEGAGLPGPTVKRSKIEYRNSTNR